MIRLNQIPILRLLPFLMLGIALQTSFPNLGLSYLVWIGLAVSLMLLLVFSLFKNKNITQSVALYIGVIALGIASTILYHAPNNPNFYGHYLTGQNQDFKVVISSEPVEKEKTIKVVANVTGIKTTQQVQPTKGNLILYLAKSATSLALTYGDELYINMQPKPFDAPLNLGEFDYKSYINKQNVFYLAFANDNNYVVGNNVASPFWQWLYGVRANIKQQFINYGLTDNAKGIAQALILGDVEEIDDNLNDAYAATGTIHILSVSGMHLGIVYLVLNFLLGFLWQTQRQRLLKLGIIVITIWLYALLAGFSSPVVRAAIMLSLIAYAQTIYKITSGYNILAVACFATLLLTPLQLYNIGFQFSYLAVLSLFLTYQPVYNLYKTRFWADKALWSLTASTLSALILTMPVTLYYFHTIPTFVVVANWVVVPLSFIAMMGSILLLIVSPIEVVASWVGKGVFFIINLLNDSILHINNYSFTSINNIAFTGIELLLILLTITALLVGFLLKKKQGLLIGVASLVIFFSVRIYLTTQQYRHAKLVVYALKKNTAVELTQSSTSRLALYKLSEKNFDYKLKNAQTYFRVNHRQVDSLATSSLLVNNILQYQGHTLAIINPSFDPSQQTTLAQAQWVLIQNNPFINPDSIAKLKPKLVIVDGSNSVKKIKYYTQSLTSKGIQVYNVLTQGAFVYTF